MNLDPPLSARIPPHLKDALSVIGSRRRLLVDAQGGRARYHPIGTHYTLYALQVIEDDEVSIPAGFVVLRRLDSLGPKGMRILNDASEDAPGKGLLRDMVRVFGTQIAPAYGQARDALSAEIRDPE